MPPASPTLVKRRLTPLNPASDVLNLLVGLPISRAMEIAASALETLLAVHRQGNAFQQTLVVMRPVGDDDIEFRAGACALHIAGANIGLWGESVGDNAAIRNAQ